MMKFLKPLSITATLFLLSSCSLFAPEAPRDLHQDIPAFYSAQVGNGEETAHPNEWWKEFGSEELNHLVEEALSKNLSLKQTYARLQQAGATAVQNGASLYPSLNATGSRNATQTHADGTGSTTADSYALGSVMSYELDLWGRVRSNATKADFDYKASVEDLHAAHLSLVAEVVTKWLNIITYQKRIETLQTQLQANKTALNLIELRYQKGQARLLDVYQQRQVVAQTDSKIPPLEAQLHSYQSQLIILLGEMPGNNLDRVQTLALPRIQPIPRTGLPADLLATRPDVRQAMMDLQSAQWQLSAAKSDMLPKISLSASYLYSAQTSAALFDNWIATLAANLTAPLFQGGYKLAEVTKSKALIDEKLNAYKETVLTSVQDVEEALVNEQKQNDYIKAVQNNRDAAENAYQEALMHYRKGLGTYLPVLTALASLQSLENDLITAQQDALLYRVTLYKALGRGWK